MAKKWVKNFLRGFFGAIPVVILVIIFGIDEMPLPNMLLWTIGIGVVLGVLYALIDRLCRKKSMKHNIVS